MELQPELCGAAKGAPVDTCEQLQLVWAPRPRPAAAVAAAAARTICWHKSSNSNVDKSWELCGVVCGQEEELPARLADCSDKGRTAERQK